MVKMNFVLKQSLTPNKLKNTTYLHTPVNVTSCKRKL